MLYKISAFVLTLLLLSFVLLSCQKPITPSSETNTSARTPASMFANYCASCHGLQGSRTSGAGGILTPSRLVNLSDAQIKETIKKGNGIMPSFEDKLSPSEIEALIAFLK